MFSNSGGPGLPGMTVEFDFRSIKKMKVNCSEETKSFLLKSYQYEKKKNNELKGKGTVDTFIINQKDST